MSKTSEAAGLVKAFIDRILRLKEEQDNLTEDVKEVYAEVKSMGFDKTVMGLAVAKIRKRRKAGDGAVDEQESVLNLYLQAYEEASGTPLASHARETVPHDPKTGEIVERAQ